MEICIKKSESFENEVSTDDDDDDYDGGSGGGECCTHARRRRADEKVWNWRDKSQPMRREMKEKKRDRVSERMEMQKKVLWEFAFGS